MSKSIKNDADIMLLISQHFSNVSVTESDTVFRVASKENYTSQGSGPIREVQTGTLDIYCVYSEFKNRPDTEA